MRRGQKADEGCAEAELQLRKNGQRVAAPESSSRAASVITPYGQSDAHPPLPHPPPGRPPLPLPLLLMLLRAPVDQSRQRA